MVENMQTEDPPQNKAKQGSKSYQKSALKRARKVTGDFHRRVSHQSTEFCTNLLLSSQKSVSEINLNIVTKNKIK